MPGDAPAAGNSWVMMMMVVPRVTSRTEDVASAKRMGDDDEKDSKISSL
jgi:hypothetical protein